MYAPDVETQSVTVKLPVAVLKLVKDSNDTPMTLEQVLAFMIIEKVNDIVSSQDELPGLPNEQS
jgi:hypothetical protein